MPFAPVADRLCAIERFGQKTGGGWYDYQSGDRTPKPSETVAAIIAKEATGKAQHVWDECDIADAIILPMVNEATRILEERVALRSADIDLVKVHGHGFPRWRGGPMHYAEARGLAELVIILDRLATEGLAQPSCDGLRREASVFPRWLGSKGPGVIGKRCGLWRAAWLKTESATPLGI